jgi:hypothetical protein
VLGNLHHPVRDRDAAKQNVAHGGCIRWRSGDNDDVGVVTKPVFDANGGGRRKGKTHRLPVLALVTIRAVAARSTVSALAAVSARVRTADNASRRPANAPRCAARARIRGLTSRPVCTITACSTTTTTSAALAATTATATVSTRAARAALSARYRDGRNASQSARACVLRASIC